MENGQVLEEIEIPIKDGENLKTYFWVNPGKLCENIWIKLNSL